MFKKIVFSLCAFLSLNSYAGSLTEGFNSQQSYHYAQTLPFVRSVALLENAAPTGVLIHPKAVLTCAHFKHFPGETVKIVDEFGRITWQTNIVESFINPQFYCEQKQASSIDGLTSLNNNDAQTLIWPKDTKFDLQILILEKEVPTHIALPVERSSRPVTSTLATTVSYGPIFEMHGYTIQKTKECTNMAPNVHYVKHAFVSKLNNIKNQYINSIFSHSSQKCDSREGSSVRGDSGSPVFVFENEKWKLFGISSTGSEISYGAETMKAPVCLNNNWIDSILTMHIKTRI